MHRQSLPAIIDHDGFIGRHFIHIRRHKVVIIVIDEILWRQRTRCEARKALASFSGMLAARITLQISPIGLLAIGLAGAGPGGGLAPLRHQRANTRRLIMPGVEFEKLVIAGNRIKLDGAGISLLAVEIFHGAADYRRQGLGGAKACGENKARNQPGNLPRGFRPFGEIMNAQAKPLHHGFHRQARFAQNLGQSHGIMPVIGGGERRKRPWAGVKSNKKPRLRFNQREAACAFTQC